MNINTSEHSGEGALQCQHCQIRGISLFSALQDEDFALIHEPIHKRRFGKREVIYRADEPGHSVFTIREGVVKLVDHSAPGGERIVRLLRRGDVAGMEALLGRNYQHHAVTLDATVICGIPVSVVNGLSRQSPTFHYQLLNRWQRAVKEADVWLTELGSGALKKRVARLLIRLAEADVDGNCFMPRREDIAAMLGVTVESVSRITAEFKRVGFITGVKRSRISVDTEGLRRIAG